MYTGMSPPLPTPSEVVPTEPPMGQPIRVIGKKPWNTMDPMSRVNFLKLYTVEHNVKVEDFGRVDSNDEWKLMAQFKLHWGIEDAEALPPARHSRYYDGDTYGPAPPNTHSGAYASSSTTVPSSQSTYDTSSTTPTPTLSSVQPSNQHLDPSARAYSQPANASYSAPSYPLYSSSNNQPHSHSNDYAYRMSSNLTYAPSGKPPYTQSSNPAYTATNNAGYEPSHNAAFSTSATNVTDDLYEDDRRTLRPRRPSEASSDRIKRFPDPRRRN
jgi:hypothetical protein